MLLHVPSWGEMQCERVDDAHTKVRCYFKREQVVESQHISNSCGARTHTQTHTLSQMLEDSIGATYGVFVIYLSGRCAKVCGVMSCAVVGECCISLIPPHTLQPACAISCLIIQLTDLKTYLCFRKKM